MTIETLLTSISTRFIHASTEDQDDEIRRALEEVGEFVGCDRAHVLLLAHGPGEVLEQTHGWTRRGVATVTGLAVPANSLGTWMERLARFERVTVDRTGELEPDERLRLHEMGIADVRSVALLPLAYSKALVGCLVFQRVESDRPFEDTSISLLENLGVIFVNALRHREAREETAQLEEQLRQSQKLEAIGTLAGGVAHDMNNVLGAIMGAASLLKQDTEPGDERQEGIGDILEACKRGRKLTRNLLGFARKGKYRRERVYLWQLVGELEEILRRTVDKRIHIATHMDPEMPPVAGDPNQLHHALMNLCLNAVDAMPEGGDLTLTVDDLLVEPVDPDADLPGAFVRVQVADTGEGMATETLVHAFEPFYTTKAKGLGTGLGLSMVYGAVENHGGSVSLDSTPGEGTTVTLLLPALHGEAFDGPEETVETEAFQSVGEVVLLVDDEDLIRRVGERLLRKLGYRVVLAADGAAAVKILDERTREVSLIILDLVMPDMDGEETFHRLREIDPLVPIVLSSGYSKDDKVERLLLAGANGFLPKPFELKHLAREMKQISLYGFDEESGPV
jgi:two-component system, cell cycle sensor histidine kinase and response regulator CckA